MSHRSRAASQAPCRSTRNLPSRSGPQALFGLKFLSTISMRWISPRYRSIDDRSSALSLLVGTFALSRRMSMIGRPTNVGRYSDPGISPVMTKNVAWQAALVHHRNGDAELIDGRVVEGDRNGRELAVLPFRNRGTRFLAGQRCDTQEAGQDRQLKMLHHCRPPRTDVMRCVLKPSQCIRPT